MGGERQYMIPGAIGTAPGRGKTVPRSVGGEKFSLKELQRIKKFREAGIF
jgi:hypothetical protein